MNKINKLFVDLDGTVTDSKEGITKSIQYALTQMSIEPPSVDGLEWCIGPPLTEVFTRLLKTKNAVTVETAVSHYRDRYAGICMIENIPYEGVEQTLSGLKAAGYDLYLATSKPWVYANKILEHFDLLRFFTSVHGSELDGTRDYKKELLAYILKQHNLDKREVAMIGDRSYDIIGAKHNDLFSVGVTYGYGSNQELQAAGADMICDHHSDLVALFVTNKVNS